MKLTKLRVGMLVAVLASLVPAVAVSSFVDVVPGAFYEAPVN